MNNFFFIFSFHSQDRDFMAMIFFFFYFPKILIKMISNIPIFLFFFPLLFSTQVLSVYIFEWSRWSKIKKMWCLLWFQMICRIIWIWRKKKLERKVKKNVTSMPDNDGNDDKYYICTLQWMRKCSIILLKFYDFMYEY